MTTSLERPIPLVVLDTNCFIAATKPESTSRPAVIVILGAAEGGHFTIGVSKHTIHELSAGSERIRLIRSPCGWRISGRWSVKSISGEGCGARVGLIGISWNSARNCQRIPLRHGG